MTHPDTPELDELDAWYAALPGLAGANTWQILPSELRRLLAKRELEGRIAALVAMRERMYNYFHVITATMNDKEAISAFDYEFEEQLARLREELAKYE